MNDLIDDDWSEAVDADIPRVDLVGRAANGSPGFLLMKQEQGLLDAEYVRELIAKAEPEPEPDAEEKVTMTGSPAAIAKMIHAASQRRAIEKPTVALQELPGEPDSYEAVAKAKYDADDLRRMAASGAAMEDESYPVADEEDLERAIRAVGRGGADHDAIRRHVAARAKALGASSEIPDNWNADGSLKDGSVTKEMGMELDDGIDGMDPTVVLAEPAEEAPGDPTDPGSPAWEAIDAATACKWTAILARARSALGVMADREMLEAAGADPDDAEAAWDLQEAACAIDYAISVLAPFAVDEQAEADMGAMELEMLGKALASFDPAPLDTIEALGQVRKAGRVLSTANEQAIRGAVESLQKVLASLPTAPATEESGQPVAKTANEEPDMATPTPAEDVTAASGQEPAMGTAQAEPKPVAGLPVTDVAKAKTPQVAIYDANGNLVGTVDPAEITMLAPAKAPEAKDDDGPVATPEQAPAAEPPADAADLTPAPSAEAGTPADAVAADDDGNVAKAAQTSTTDTSQLVLKSDIQELLKAAIDEHSAPHTEALAKQASDLAAQADLVKTLEERNTALETQLAELQKQVKNIEDQPAVMAIASNGAIPPAHLMRGQDQGAPVGSTQAEALRKQWAASDDAVEQKRLSDELNGLAIARLRELRPS